MQLSEAETRKKIDAVLESSGWKVVSFKEHFDYSQFQACAIREFPTENGPADYLLMSKGQVLAILEAKKESLSSQNVVSQAHRYAKGIKPTVFGVYGIPFVYSSNGINIWFQDLRNEKSYSRQVSKFHTPKALLAFVSKNDEQALQKLSLVPLHSRLRSYQRNAIDAVETAIRRDKRAMLVAMATGTGKTFATCALIYRLMKSGVAKRILFLVDRRALAAQAIREFSTFEAEPGKKFDKLYEVYSQRFKREDFEEGEKFDSKVMQNNYLTDPNSTQAFVYVSTIQRMRITLFGSEGAFWENEASDEGTIQKLDIPIHAFDLIIADECHRGYTAAEISKWRETLDHFDAIKIGLTATPAAHTKAYFNDVVFRYGYDQAIKDGYLVDYDVVTINSKVKMSGLFLKENELVGVVDTEKGIEKLDKIEEERLFESSKIEREITSPDSIKKVVKEFAAKALEQEQLFGHFPKSLFFAVNDLPNTSHADRLVKALREEFGRGDSFVQKITGSSTVDRPLQKIREFRNRPEPGIVVTVDMLSTGVDIPALENIVFLRPVKSRILFTQMLGRGTRLCPEINKSHFTVFDCFSGTLLEYFKKSTDFTVDPPEKPTRTLQEVINDVYHNNDRDYNVKCLSKRLQRIAKEMDGTAIEDFAHYIPKGDISKFAQTLPDAIKNNFIETIGLLRDSNFQNLLATYPRKPKSFLIAYESQDQVSSEYVFRTITGNELKPPDYIKAFEEFVKNNPEKIDAIKILLSKPREWDTDALYELRTKLAATPEKFTEDRLRKAYHHELADLISIIKHAAKKEPLLSAEERIEKAMTRLTKDKHFTPEQEKWLALIKEHLKVNLAISEQDFELPIFAREGGFKNADKEFQGNLLVLLKNVNEAVAK